ncbi:hypothetical protein ABE237_27920 [Brevibacillus formosus]|nr:hypothetical protein [Brevibacillus formosus]
MKPQLVYKVLRPHCNHAAKKVDEGICVEEPFRIILVSVRVYG